MENPAISALRREMEAANEKVSALTAELRELKAHVKSYESAIEQLGGVPPMASTSASPSRSNRIGERLEDKILDEIAWASGTNARQIAEKLTANGRPTGETTVSSLISRLKKDGKVVRREDGLVYKAGWSSTPSSPGTNFTNDPAKWGADDDDLL